MKAKGCRGTRPLLSLGVANIVLAVLIPLACSYAVSIAYAVALGAYRVLDTRGVINHEVLANVWGAEYSRDWALVVRRLIHEPLIEMLHASYIIGMLFALNGLVMLALWVRSRRKMGQLGSSPPEGDAIISP